MNKRASQSAEERKLHALATELELTRDERIELAQMLLRRDIRSWSELDPAQVCRLLDAFDGYGLITALLEMRAPDPPASDHRT